MDDLRRIVGLYDIHTPDNIPLDGVIKFIRDFKPTHLVNGGDFLHLESIRELAKKQHIDVGTMEVTRAINELKKEFAGANDILDKIDAALPKECTKIFLEGNHEYWLRQIIEIAPTQKPIFDPRLNLRLTERGYSWVPMNKTCNIGRLYFAHGIYTNKYHAAKTLSIYQRNIVYGHCHTHQVFTSSSPIDDEGKTAIAVPCLCGPGAYMRGRPSSWINGFFIAYSDPKTNFFWPYIVTMIRNRFISPDGKSY